MKKKELKAIALKIVKLETIISENSDEQAVTNAKLELMRLTDSIESLSDIHYCNRQYRSRIPKSEILTFKKIFDIIFTEAKRD